MEIWKSQKRGFPHFHRLGGYDDKNEVPNPKNRTENVKHVPGWTPCSQRACSQRHTAGQGKRFAQPRLCHTSIGGTSGAEASLCAWAAPKIVRDYDFPFCAPVDDCQRDCQP